MDQLLINASNEGNLNDLYAAIQLNPHVLVQIEEIPFVDTPLHVAAFVGHIEFTMEIMSLKPSLAKKLNQDGFSPMHLALQQGHTQLVLWLIDLDAELVRVKGREGITPLHYVASNGNVDLLSAFLSFCPKSVEDFTILHESALHIALKNYKHEAFEVMINMLSSFHDDNAHHRVKRILNVKDLDGNSLLHIVASKNQYQALELVLKYNSSYPGMLELNTVNNQGLTALDLAHNLNYMNIQRPLQQAGGVMASTLRTSTPLSQQQGQNFTQSRPPTSANNPTHLSSDVEDQNSTMLPYNIFFDLKKSSPDNARTDLLVVAALMAIISFLVGLNPPGGFGENNIAVFSSNEAAYILFIFFNSAGFFASTCVITALLYNYPWFWNLCVAILAIIAAYDIGIVSISPPGYMRSLFSTFVIVLPLSFGLTPYIIQIYFMYIRGSA